VSPYNLTDPAKVIHRGTPHGKGIREILERYFQAPTVLSEAHVTPQDGSPEPAYDGSGRLMSRISMRSLPRGTWISAISPLFFPRRPWPIGLVVRILLLL